MLVVTVSVDHNVIPFSLNCNALPSSSTRFFPVQIIQCESKMPDYRPDSSLKLCSGGWCGDG